LAIRDFVTPAKKVMLSPSLVYLFVSRIVQKKNTRSIFVEETIMIWW